MNDLFLLNSNDLDLKDFESDNSDISTVKNNINLNIDQLLHMNFFSYGYFDGKTYLNIDKSFLDYIKYSNYKEYLIKILLSHHINKKHIDYLKLPDDLSKESKREIYSIIYNNFPILSIERIKKEDNLLNVNFFGIKKINDNIGKVIVDEFISGIKKYIITSFDSLDNNGRLILNTYKNILFSHSLNEDILKELLVNISNINILIDYIFDNFFDKNLINGKDITEIKNIFYKNFNIGFGTHKVVQNNKISKLISYYISSMGSKKKFNNVEGFILNHYDIKKMITISDIVIKVKTMIEESFIGEKVTINGIDYDIITYNNGNNQINEKIISYYRKGGKNLPEVLLSMLSLYTNIINENLDFFSPQDFSNDLYSEKDVALLNKGYVNPVFIKYNHKGYFNTDYFNEYAKLKQGFNCFIDIVNMGNTNINDSVKLCSNIRQGLLKGKNIEMGLLNGGSTGTGKLIKLANSIREKFPNVIITVGGDEIFLHFELNEPSHEILDFINSKTYEIGLHTRISYGNNLEIGYDGLDELTKINKYFEYKIEKIMYDKGFNLDLSVIQFEIFVKPSMNFYILKNMDLFIQELDKNLDNDLLSKIIVTGNFDKKVVSEFTLYENNILNSIEGFFLDNTKFKFNISLSKVKENENQGKIYKNFKIIIG